MGLDGRVISTLGGTHVISALGGLYIAIAIWRALAVAVAGEPVMEVVLELFLIGLPGAVILYGGSRLPATDLHPAVYPRIVAWCFGGLGVMLVILGLLELSPAGGGIDQPIFTVPFGTALGSAGGLSIGTNEARAISRARDAERHRDELRYERDLRESIVDLSPVGITVVNADRSTSLVNDRAAEIVGLPQEDLLELEYDESLFEATDAEGNPLEQGVFEQVLSTGKAVYDAERQITRPDGRRIWLSVSGAPLHDPAGAVTGIIFAFEDITKRIEHEQQLETSNERLEQFAYAASHDLQEPLRMVSSYLQLIERRYADAFDGDGREYLTFAVNGADRMRAMIDSLLDYSRITTHGKPLEPTDAQVVLEDVLDDLHLHIEETNATITAGDLPTVIADADQLAQVFRNLLLNALKYSGDEPPQVQVGVERTTDAWRFSVADDGIGIEPEYHDQIFEVFKSVHSAEEGSGSGIGLALCERIVERHGGEIWVESAPGTGSTFYFTIPTIEDPSASSAPLSTHSEQANGRTD